MGRALFRQEPDGYSLPHLYRGYHGSSLWRCRGTPNVWRPTDQELLNQHDPRAVRALRIHEFKGLAGVTLDAVPHPEPAADQLLIRVVAASVNPADIKIAQGLFPRVKHGDLPATLGCDFSGVVERCPQYPALFRTGDSVFGMARPGSGSFSDYLAVDADTVALAPKTIDLKESAAVPLAALTAWQGLTLHGDIVADQRVLILGAGGGVGHFAVQFARHLGAEVYALGAARDVQFLRDLGADHVLDRESAFETIESKMDLVLDLVGGSTQDRSWGLLENTGIIVSPVSQPNERYRSGGGRPGRRFVLQPRRTDLERIASLLEAGVVRPVITSRFGLEDAHEALTQLERGGIRGKSVLFC
jgi:NADPH:quinone reductase-like Zn-dependent oxidoreductase